MAHVFISYSKKNRGYARKLADSLLARGFDVWMDDRIDYGRNWERVIFQAIEQCAAFVVIMTPEAYSSDWVLRECQYADKRRKPTFPILLEGEEFPRYGPTQYADVRDGSLPPEEFYEHITEVVPPKVANGKLVTDEQPPVREGNEYPGEQTLQQRRGVTFPGGRVVAVGLVIALAAAAGLLVPLAFPQPTPTNTREAGTPLVSATALLAITRTQAPTTIPPPTEPPAPTATQSIAQVAPDEQSLAQVPENLGQDAAQLPQYAQQSVDQLSQASDQLDNHPHLVFLSDRQNKHAIYLLDTDGSDPFELFEETGIGSMHVSPDGQRLALDLEISGQRDIHILGSDGSTLQVTDHTENDYMPRWSPDGQSLVFISDRYGDPDVFTIDLASDVEEQITSSAEAESDPSWSPDGQYIIFTREQNGGKAFYTRDRDGNERLLLENFHQNAHPVWSPDSRQIAFMSDLDGWSDIYTMELGTGEIALLTEGDDDIYNGYPEWSPDGSEIAYWSNRDGNHEIYVMNRFGDDDLRLTYEDANDYGVVWWPTGDFATNLATQAGVEVRTFVVRGSVAEGEEYHSPMFEACTDRNVAVTVRAISGELDPFAHLMNEQNALVAENDDHESDIDGLNSHDSYLEAGTPAGNYFVVVTGYNNSSGEFEVVVTC